MNLYAVLMAGGVGTRFWPRSRAASPKQVLNISGKETMIQATTRRLEGLVEASRTLIVTNDIQQPIIQEQLPELSRENFVIETFGRNTAPCIGLAALQVAAQDPEGVMVVLPADHVIGGVDEFQAAIRFAANFAFQNDAIVTLGITPYEPATGYGYIQAGDTVAATDSHRLHKVLTFAEKPDLETANRFLDSGNFFWNSGMFIWKAATVLQEIQRHLPEMHALLMEIGEAIGAPDYRERLADAYGRIQNISIDYGIMQQADSVYVIPADMGWNDVGSWETVHDISAKDRHGHAGECPEIVSIGSRNSYVYAPDKLVALVGVEDLIVVDTGDALLVCRKSAAQDVKHVVDHLKKQGREDLL